MRGIKSTWGFALAGLSLLLGTADSLHLDPIRGILDVEGRDLSAALVEARVDETFANRTSSEVAALFASRHGLQADVTTTSTPIGRLYGNERDRLTTGHARAATEWDLLAAGRPAARVAGGRRAWASLQTDTSPAPTSRS